MLFLGEHLPRIQSTSMSATTPPLPADELDALVAEHPGSGALVP